MKYDPPPYTPEPLPGVGGEMTELSVRIAEGISSLRAGAKRRTSTDAIQKWYPYYAGYSLEFAESVLRSARLAPSATVLDPWNGSGTTTLAAAKLGLRGRGLDLNPFAVLVARARLVNSEDARGIRGWVGQCAHRLPTHLAEPRADPLCEWLPKTTVAHYRWIQSQVLVNFAMPKEGEPLDVENDAFPPLASFLILALVRAARTLVKVRPTSNPTTFRPRTSHPRRPTSPLQLAKVWAETANEMGDDLPLVATTPIDAGITIGDARQMKLVGVADFVLTSPPYCTRLDYGDATRFELAATAKLANSQLASLRRSLMGAPLVRERGRPAVPEVWPIAVRELLARVRAHKSKASDSYYFKTYHQYFADVYDSLRSIHQALKPRSAAAVIVQTSYYKEIKIRLPDLYVDLAVDASLRATVACRMPVRTVLASIHPGTQTYRDTWEYEESVVLLWKD